MRRFKTGDLVVPNEIAARYGLLGCTVLKITKCYDCKNPDEGFVVEVEGSWYRWPASWFTLYKNTIVKNIINDL